MTDVVQIVTAFFSLIGVIFTGVMAYKMAQLKTGQDKSLVKQDEAAVKVEDAVVRVRHAAAKLQSSTEETAQQLAEIAEVGVKTHMLVNSAMLAQKKLLAATARALANKTNDPVDIAAAEVAEADAHEHELKQQRVNKRDSPETLIPDTREREV